MGRGREHGEDGFTLIELMVVVLIIAILLAIAIPSYIGAQARASERKSQTALRNALTAARTIATDLGNYAFEVGTDENPISASELHDADRAFQYSDNTADADADTMVVKVSTAPGLSEANTRIHLFAGSRPGRYFGLTSTTRGRVFYCKGMSIAEVENPDTCSDGKW